MNKTIAFLSILAACGGPSNSGDDDTQPDAPPMSHLDAAVAMLCANAVHLAASTCGTPLPAGGQASIETWCKKGVTTASLCGGSPAAGLDCFASPDATDWVCQLGQPYPSCNGDLAAGLGAYCLMASGNPSCASGIHCDYDVDCSGNAACNSVTHQCFQKTAYCIGLSCGYDVDCPNNEKCNSAEHACVGN